MCVCIIRNLLLSAFESTECSNVAPTQLVRALQSSEEHGSRNRRATMEHQTNQIGHPVYWQMEELWYSAILLQPIYLDVLAASPKTVVISAVP